MNSWYCVDTEVLRFTASFSIWNLKHGHFSILRFHCFVFNSFHKTASQSTSIFKCYSIGSQEDAVLSLYLLNLWTFPLIWYLVQHFVKLSCISNHFVCRFMLWVEVWHGSVFIPEISSVVILYSLWYFYYAVLYRESSPKVT